VRTNERLPFNPMRRARTSERVSFKERFRAEELVAKWNALKALEPIEADGRAVTYERPPLD